MNFKKKLAFSMIEITAVMFVIALLAVTLGPSLYKFMFKGQVSATKTIMTGITAGLANYRMDLGHFPNSKQGLEALIKNVENNPKWDGPYLVSNTGDSGVPQDKWGFDFIYNCPPQVTGKKFKYYELVSYGEHGEGSPEKEWLIFGE